jgi:hypothetical protein
MTMLRRLIARVTPRGSPSDAEIERELRDHLELEAESLAQDGHATANDARFVARRRFGNVSAARESVRDVWRWTWLEHLEQDARHGWRAMVRSPAYSVALIATMAMGIGTSTTVYTLARAIHTPFPALPQNRLVWITYANARCGVDCTELSPAAFAALQQRAPSITAIGTYRWTAALRGAEGSEPTRGFIVSPNAWEVVEAPSSRWASSPERSWACSRKTSCFPWQPTYTPPSARLRRTRMTTHPATSTCSRA